MNDIEKSKLDTIAAKINDHNYVLSQSARKTVEEAAAIGALLVEAQGICEHGNFLPWLESKTKISKSTAYRYMDLSRLGTKLPKLGNLDDANKAVEDHRAQEKRREDEKKMALFAKRKKTGEAPDGWTVAMEREFKAHYDDQARTERIQKVISENKASADLRREQAELDQKRSKAESEALNQSISDLQSYMKKLEHTKQAMSGNEDLLFMIDGYLAKLESDSRRHEFCNTLIKHLRAKSIEYGRGK